MTEPIQVLVVDDSALMRKMIPQILQRDPGIRVVGTAMDGAFALQKAAELRPDVITLDLEMPRMNGIAALREFRKLGLPVIVVSAHSTEGASTTFKALAIGAFDFVAKPAHGASAHIEDIAHELTAKIRAAAQARIAPPPVPSPEFPQIQKKPRPKIAPARVVAIGVSTGGPNSVQYVLSQLPADFPGAILVVQHMPEGFTEMFAKRLDATSAIHVKEAESGDMLIAGRALICPGNRHMKVRRATLGDVVVLTDEDRVNGHRPSVDVLFRSVAQEFGSQSAAVLMTGMGDDGAEGMGAIKSAGGMTIAQNAESCVVYGMPRAAIERGYAIRVASLESIPNAIQSLCANRAAHAPR